MIRRTALIGVLVLAAIVPAVGLSLAVEAGVERAQQKWLVAPIGAMAILFPLSLATDRGLLADAIDLLSVFVGATVLRDGRVRG